METEIGSKRKRDRDTGRGTDRDSRGRRRDKTTKRAEKRVKDVAQLVFGKGRQYYACQENDSERLKNCYCIHLIRLFNVCPDKKLTKGILESNRLTWRKMIFALSNKDKMPSWSKFPINLAIDKIIIISH